MMGSLFTDLTEMLESRYGLARTQKIIDAAHLENGGAFTAVGYYSRPELDKFLQSIMAELGGSEQQWLHELGLYMSEAHIQRNPELYGQVNSFPEFLLRVNDMAQAKVATLYPDKQVPAFSTRIIDEDTIEFTYTSSNRLGDLTIGWINGHAEYFQDKIEIDQTPLTADGSSILFLIKRVKE